MADSERPAERKHIAVLTPVYNEEASLPEYERRVQESLLSCDEYSFEILLIDDGSTDRSWRIIEAMSRRDSRFQGIRLSRNFGSHVALSAGFVHVRPTADALATLACDLQDPPEVVIEFARVWRSGPQIVWGKRRSRQDVLWRTWTSRLFQMLIRRFAMPRGSKFTTGSFFLLDRRVVECFRQFQETNRVTFALVAWTGFDQAIVEYDRKQRTEGTSRWTFGRMLRSMYDTFIGFSTLPVRLITWIGLSTFLLAVLISMYVLIVRLAGGGVPGWASTILVTTFFASIQFFLLGMIGEYLYRIYAEVVRRPLFFVSQSTDGREQQRA